MINLIIVNVQSDFVSGTRGKKGNRIPIENIKKFIKLHYNEIDKIIFAIEWHPYNHSSFIRYGGEYPPHCVQYTPGACIEPKLLKFVHSYDLNYEICKRGMNDSDAENIVFREIEESPDGVFGKHYYLDTVSTNSNNDYIVCGMGISVKYALENLIDGGITPKVFFPGTFSEDGGKILSEFVKEHNIEKIAQ